MIGFAVRLLAGCDWEGGRSRAPSDNLKIWAKAPGENVGSEGYVAVCDHSLSPFVVSFFRVLFPTLGVEGGYVRVLYMRAIPSSSSRSNYCSRPTTEKGTTWTLLPAERDQADETTNMYSRPWMMAHNHPSNASRTCVNSHSPQPPALRHDVSLVQPCISVSVCVDRYVFGVFGVERTSSIISVSVAIPPVTSMPALSVSSPRMCPDPVRATSHDNQRR